jgi:hypothetical protein
MRPALFMVLLFACQGTADLAALPDSDGRPPDVERDLVGSGVARLSARHVAALLKAIEVDTRCGFGSPAVQSAVQVSGKPGDDGTATWTVSGCKLSFPTERNVQTDCNGAQYWVSGTVTISATRTLHGVLTEDMSQPVAPDSADSASVDLQVTFDHFEVRDDATNNSMVVKTGELSVTAVPQLAPNNSNGICSIATPQLTLHALTLTHATVLLHALGYTLDDVQIPTMSLELQVGQGPQHENWFSGAVTVWETRVDVPTPDDHDGLDPDYARDAFIQSFACDANLQQPLGGACPPPREKPAQGAAALSVQLFGTVAKLIENDTHCGFGMSGLSGVPMGSVGSKGSMVFTLPAPCTLTFAPGTVVDTDCSGKQTVLEGAVTVTGTKTVSGYLVGDPAEPVVPASSSPVEFRLTLTANELKLSQPGSPNSLQAHSGNLAGSLTPKTGLDTSKGVCSIGTPIAHVTLAHDSFAVEVNNGSISVPITLSTSSLEAQIGSNGGQTNLLKGQVVASGQMLDVPSDGAAPVLDPSYDPATFAASFMCTTNLQMPTSEDECKLSRLLGEGAARLMIRDTAAAVQLIEDNGACGFQNQDLLKKPISVQGGPGSNGSMAWAASCGMGPGMQGPWSTDCNNVTTTLEGTTQVSATRVVNGVRDQICKCILFICACVDTIHPTPSDAVKFTAHATFSNFAAGTSDGRLIIHSGAVDAVVRPMQGQDTSNGWFDIGTPVAAFDSVVFTSGTMSTGDNVTLVAGPKTFTFAVSEAHLSAFNGAFKGDLNRLSGTITVDGVEVALGMLPLQPNYAQAAFDQTYACTPHLASVLAPN